MVTGLWSFQSFSRNIRTTGISGIRYRWTEVSRSTPTLDVPEYKERLHAAQLSKHACNPRAWWFGLYTRRAYGWTTSQLGKRWSGALCSRFHLMNIILWSASKVYRVVHVAGWHEKFTTKVEVWFWRISAIYVMFSELLRSFCKYCMVVMVRCARRKWANMKSYHVIWTLQYWPNIVRCYPSISCDTGNCFASHIANYYMRLPIVNPHDASSMRAVSGFKAFGTTMWLVLVA